MKKGVSILILFVAIATFTSCSKPTVGGSSQTKSDQSSLTTAKAQTAIKKWINNRGEVKVLGVQELSTENAAKADLQFTNFRFRSAFGEEVHSGPGIAVFSHYNDGRWVLKKIQWTTPRDYYTDNADIEVQ